MIGADAAVSSIMDGDDADGGAKPARRGERNRNRERKWRGRQTQPGAARTHTYTHQRACVTLSFDYTALCSSHPGTRPHTVTETHTCR